MPDYLTDDPDELMAMKFADPQPEIATDEDARFHQDAEDIEDAHERGEI